MTNNKISDPVQALTKTVVASEAINRGRAVCFDGYEYDGTTYTKFLGIADTSQDSGYNVLCLGAGVVVCEAGEAIATAGGEIGLDSSGRAVAIANAVDPTLIIGRNIDTASAAAAEMRVFMYPTSTDSASADGLGRMQMARATYDFSVDGGTVGDIGLDVTLPDNAIMLGGIIDVVTGVTFTAASPAGTLAIKAQTANDILTATAAGSLTAGLVAPTALDYTATNAIKLTAAREITVTIANQAVTAGKLIVYVAYVVSV